jgi:hypothetical protein
MANTLFEWLEFSLGSADLQIKEDGRIIGVTGFVFASSLRDYRDTAIGRA